MLSATGRKPIGGVTLADLPVRRLMVANATLRFVLIHGLADADLGAAAHDAVQQGTAGKVLIDLP